MIVRRRNKRKGNQTFPIKAVISLLLIPCAGCRPTSQQKNILNGIAQLNDNHPASARKEFQKAMASSADNPELGFNIAQLFEQSGFGEFSQPFKDQACRESLIAIKKQPRNGSLINDYAYSCLVEPKKDLDTAIQLLSRAAYWTNHEALVIDSLGWAYYQRYQISKNRRDITAALTWLEGAVERSPGSSSLFRIGLDLRMRPDTASATLRYHLGMAYIATHHLDESYVELYKATSLDPSLDMAQTALSEVIRLRQQNRNNAK